jgi:hypothetical protein
MELEYGTNEHTTPSAFGSEQRRMLSINQRFGRHYTCHLQGESIAGRVLKKSYIGQAVDGVSELMPTIRSGSLTKIEINIDPQPRKPKVNSRQSIYAFVCPIQFIN